MVQLYDVISNGYKNGYKNKKIDGFELDPTLSNENNQLYVNKKDKKIIININLLLFKIFLILSIPTL